ncbi:hypothetical protein QJQ45_013464 [Haematococcus lacustris]|nr:hypothetical protein QJQ45_013464 [Haematococcus lacustris]
MSNVRTAAQLGTSHGIEAVEQLATQVMALLLAGPAKQEVLARLKPSNDRSVGRASDHVHLDQTLSKSQSLILSQPQHHPRSGHPVPALLPATSHQQHPQGHPSPPLDSEDPVMLAQLKEFCIYFANSNFLTPYNQLANWAHIFHILKLLFDDPNNQELLAKLQQLGSTNPTERFVKLYAKAARAMLGWIGVETQLFIKLACGYALNVNSSELQASNLSVEHVDALKDEAAKQRLLLGLEELDSLQDTLPLPCRMRHAVHVYRTRKLAKQGFEFERTVETDGVSVCVHYTRPLPPPPAPPPAEGPFNGNNLSVAAPGAATAAAHVQGLPRIGKALAKKREFVFESAAAASSAGTSLVANLKHITVTLATWDVVWEVYLDPKRARQRLRLYGAQNRALEQFSK